MKNPLTFDIITLFPDLFSSFLNESLIGKGIFKGELEIKLTDLREFGIGKHRQVDDEPYGGGPGMLLRPEPVFRALEDRKSFYESQDRKVRSVLLTPQGNPFQQKKAEELSACDECLLFICGRYEGFDERIRDYVDEEISGGDFICLGGEVIAMVLIEAISRLRGNILGNQESAEQETFSHNGILEYPQYTRPLEFRGQRVPEVLLSGHHARILEWRSQQARQRTLQRRPDLLTEKHKGKDARLDESS
ncbi:MAG: tRNA (guanosine(37)-N1)-methyltransferase TrmD [bacterium]|nr:tRNA (guanosine(37)-N1)-methyltransferase TrmD [Pseudomonadota bacterium]